MQLWDDFVTWFYSDAGAHIITTVVVPAVAILVAGIIGALIGRGATKRIVQMHEREERAAAVVAMIGAARRFARWNTLSVPEQQHAEHVALECDVRMRLLPLAGATLAADWSTHQLRDLKKSAVSFSFQAEQSLGEFRERLVAWQARPGRAKKLFKNDLDSWEYEESLNEQDLVAQQKAWQAQQAAPGNVDSFAPKESPSTDSTVKESTSADTTESTLTSAYAARAETSPVESSTIEAADSSANGSGGEPSDLSDDTRDAHDATNDSLDDASVHSDADADANEQR